MKELFTKLNFKFSLIIVIILLIINGSIAVLNIVKYAGSIKNQFTNQILLPSQLLSAELIDFNTISNKMTMENLIGNKLNQCLLIGANQKIYYSIHPNQVNKLINEVDGVKHFINIIEELDGPYYKKLKEEQAIIHISPVFHNQTTLLGYLFLNIDLTNIQNEKQSAIKKIILMPFILLIIALFFIIGFFNRLISGRLYNILSLTDKLKRGNLNVDFLKVKFKDELSKIENSLNEIINQLKLKVKFANEIEKGNFKFQYHLENNEDQLGQALIDMRDSLQKASEEEEKRKIDDAQRNWSTQGLAKFADILRHNNNNIADLAYNTINNLVKYLNANQASLFLLNKEKGGKNVLELTATYAYDRKKILKKQIEVGEGLIGAVAKECKTMYLTEIPDSYIEITSGLGKANPKTLIIVPLLRENDLLGIVEIASFNEFKKYQIEFIEKLGESIASTIYNTKINTTTSKLYETSMEQAEQMRAQEEEMRQNMEELNTTQEEMARKQASLNKKIQELEIELEHKNKIIEKYKARED